jgi:hypothetical protein
MKLILLIIYSSPVIVFLIMMIRLHYRSYLFDKWMDFNDQMLHWALEIKNTSKKTEFLNFYTSIKTSSPDDARKNYHRIKEIRKQIIEKWANDIPSLKIEIRDSKIDEILRK